MSISGTVMKKYHFFVLCLNIYMPSRAPKDPPIPAKIRSTDILILGPWLLALILSTPYRMNVIILIMIRYITTNFMTGY